MQVEDACASFLFVGDLNGYYQEWLGCKTTNCHGVVAFNFSTVSGCETVAQSQGFGTLDLAHGQAPNLLMTDVPYQVCVTVVAPIGNSDHPSLSAVISMAQAFANLYFSRKVFLRH